jgi:hypothetical protein
MSKEQRLFVARLAVVATLMLTAVASWTVQRALNHTPGIELGTR